DGKPTTSVPWGL
ncbi:hypothetical protein A2U01_0116914, partial [Trifolium medium]|nr:hypothetical protein [Trifolium medium]